MGVCQNDTPYVKHTRSCPPVRAVHATRTAPVADNGASTAPAAHADRFRREDLLDYTPVGVYTPKERLENREFEYQE